MSVEQEFGGCYTFELFSPRDAALAPSAAAQGDNPPRESGDAPPDPGEVVERIRSGDRSAEAQLVARYARGIMHVLLRYARDEEQARDLFQDTFLVALLKLRSGDIRKPASVGSFIRKIAINLTIEHYRKQDRRGEYPDSDLIARIESEHRGPVRSLEEVEQVRIVVAAIAELGRKRDRDLLFSYFVELQSKPAICEELALTPAQFDRVLHRARERLLESFRRGNGGS